MPLCPHCRWQHGIPELHLPVEAPTPRLAVGQVVTARRDTGVCRADEPGIVIEAYRIGESPGWTVQFREGGRDGWNVCEVGLFLKAGPVMAGLSDYRPADAGVLAQHLRTGLFKAAFAAAPAL